MTYENKQVLLSRLQNAFKVGDAVTWRQTVPSILDDIYRIVNGLIAIPASLYLTPNTQNTRGHGCKFRVPAECVDAFNYSFFLTRIWILEPIAGCCRYVTFHRGLQVSIDGHLGDSDVNLEIFLLFLSHTPARFYLSVELRFIVCFLHFMHICHARHYSTMRNVHYRKRRRRKYTTNDRQSTMNRLALPSDMYQLSGESGDQRCQQ